MRTLIVAVVGALTWVSGFADRSAVAAQETVPVNKIPETKPTDALQDNLPDYLIGGGISETQWFDCLRTIKVTPEQREEITPLVRTFLKERRAWGMVYAPLLERTLERRREMAAAGLDTTGIKTEIKTLRKRNPSVLKIRREVWIRLTRPQRSDLIELLKVVRDANREKEGGTSKVKASRTAPTLGGPGVPNAEAGRRSSTAPAKKQETPARPAEDSEAKTPTDVVPPVATPEAPPTGTKDAPAAKNEATPAKAGTEAASGETKSGKVEPAPWSFDD